MIGGGAAMLYGGFYYAFFHDVRRLEDSSGVVQSGNNERLYETAGLVALIGGLAAAVVGLPLWFGDTTVEVR